MLAISIKSIKVQKPKTCSGFNNRGLRLDKRETRKSIKNSENGPAESRAKQRI
jgi:hypothetical protein